MLTWRHDQTAGFPGKGRSRSHINLDELLFLSGVPSHRKEAGSPHKDTEALCCVRGAPALLDPWGNRMKAHVCRRIRSSCSQSL